MSELQKLDHFPMCVRGITNKILLEHFRHNNLIMNTVTETINRLQETRIQAELNHLKI